VRYITDNELYTEESGFQNESYKQKLISFIKHADILITNATFYDEEYERKVHWGHSCVGRAVEVAAATGVENLHLFHHDPSQTNDDIDLKLDIAQDMMAALESVTKIWAPAGGYLLTLGLNTYSAFLLCGAGLSFSFGLRNCRGLVFRARRRSPCPMKHIKPHLMANKA
jgi:hypothetical protein